MDANFTELNTLLIQGVRDPAEPEVLSADHPHEGAFLARFVHDLTVGGASDKLVTRSLTPGVVGVKGP